MVGHKILDLVIMVRVHAGQPECRIFHPGNPGIFYGAGYLKRKNVEYGLMKRIINRRNCLFCI